MSQSAPENSLDLTLEKTSEPMRLFLLDGMALIYRAHFAFAQNPIRNSKGINTSALYGFASTMLNIIEQERPTHLGVAFDTHAPTERHIIYPDYKAQRQAAPEELLAAIPQVKRLCQAMFIPILEIDGFEADDLIGTLAQRADAHGGFHTYMVTPDKDFCQLVSATTSIWRPGRKGSDHAVLDLSAVLAQWEIKRPEQVIDILGLWGDASDNIPGVPGVGEKTAKKLIADWDSMENLLANAASLKGKIGDSLLAHNDQALLSKKLATIITDAPLEVAWDDLALIPHDVSAAFELFQEFELRTIAKRLASRLPQSPTSQAATETSEAPPVHVLKTIRDVPHHYHIVDSPEQARVLFQRLTEQTAFCFDTETTSLDVATAKLLGISFSWQAHEAWYLSVPRDGLSAAWQQALQAIFHSKAKKIGHNLKYDLAILRHHGISCTGPFCDTMLAHALLHPEQRHSMDRLSEGLLHYTPIKFADIASPEVTAVPADDLFAFAASTASKNKAALSVEHIPLAILGEYAAEDADVTWQLADLLEKELAAEQQTTIFETIEAPLIPVLVRMEQQGIALDTSALTEIGQELQLRIDAMATSIHQHAGTHFNLNSPKQLGDILFNKLQLAAKAKKTTTGQFKTDEATLTTLQGVHPIIDDILTYREASKLKSTYVDALPSHIRASTGRIHTTFHQLVAATGRLASTDPNIQNIPIRSEDGRRVRKAFIPASGHLLLSCDYSQIELRVMAALSGDPSMIDAFRRNIDVHTATAAKVYQIDEASVTREMRSRAKMVNFGIIYGISAFGLAQRLAISRTEASTLIENYFAQYPGVKSYMETIVTRTREQGFTETLSGRRRHLPDIHSSNQNIRGNAERAAINTPIQGTAADMIKLAMIRIDELLQSTYQTRMLLQVHDELVFDLAPNEQEEVLPKILHAMQNALPLPHDVPIVVESGTGMNWLAAH
jgi:DNA polymerase I